MARVKIRRDKGPKNGMQAKTVSQTFRETKRDAISLGMPFPDAVAADWHGLNTYINQNCHQRKDPSLIAQYDLWIDEQLGLAGYAEDDPLRHYQLRLGYVSEEAMAKAPKLKKAKAPKEPKPKKEKDELGLWKGTKKSYTFELAKRGYELERVQKRVLKKFPDANPSSIKQWWKKARKENG